MSYDFHKLCVPHYEALVQYAGGLLRGRRQEALDLVQEAYVKALKKWPSWQPSYSDNLESSAKGWMYRIVQNLFTSSVRNAARRRRRLQGQESTVIERTYGVYDDHTLLDLSDGVGDEVRNALAELEPQHRNIILMADFEGLPYLVIAQQLEVPLGTVMSRLHRSRRKLAKVLAAYAECEYGIGLHRARPRALPDVTPESPETESDSVDCIVTGDDGGDLFG